MQKLALLAALLCLGSINLAGQSKSSFASVSYTLGTLCSTPSLDPTAVCPDTSWVITDSSGAVTYSGDGGAKATDQYGLLQGADTAVVTCPPGSAAGAAATGAGSQATFMDTLTFPGLTASGTYYIALTVKAVGSVSGGFLSGVSSVELNAEGDLTDSTTPNSVDCVLLNSSVNQGVVSQSCSTKMQVFPGDTVSLRGIFGLGANAVCPNNASTSGVTQNPQADFSSSKNFGATFILNLQGANGKKLSRREGVIVAASGTQYPTH